MRHSFTAPRSKRLISTELRLVFFFFTVTIVMLVGAYLFLGFKTYDFVAEQDNVVRQKKMLNESIGQLQEQIRVIDGEMKIAERVTTDNAVMKESIRNLFDLVPDGITLSRADLNATSLILYGITPNKETYQYMLEAPLRSIFHRTYTSFYPAENGWYQFVSSNYLDNENGEEIQ